MGAIQNKITLSKEPSTRPNKSVFNVSLLFIISFFSWDQNIELVLLCGLENDTAESGPVHFLTFEPKYINKIHPFFIETIQ